MNTIQQIEQEQIERLTADKSLPDFAPGDTVRVMVMADKARQLGADYLINHTESGLS